MSFLRRFLERLDGTLVTDLGNPIPAQRSIGPDEIIRRHLPDTTLIEEIGVWSHCRCCFPACDGLHRDACPRHQAAS